MKVEKMFTTLIVCSVMMFTSCIQAELDASGEVVLDSSPSGVASQYVKNLSVWANLSNGRSATNDTAYMDFLDNYEIRDEEGNLIVFSELDEETKIKLFEDYQNNEIAYATGVLENDEELLKIIQADNLAMEEMLKEVSRSAYVNNNGSVFLSRYIKRRKDHLQKLAKEWDSQNRSAATVTSGSIEITSGDLVESSVDAFKASYKKGRVLVSRDSSSAASSGVGLYFGHASMMHKDSWDETWEANGLCKTTISAWPDDGKTAHWEGKIDGVQEEPLVPFIFPEHFEVTSSTQTITEYRNY
ncbi:MAG: hypothetical protein J5930_11815 [Treponema sp.]|nr:hypothetical protein [Treponema sp.]